MPINSCKFPSTAIFGNSLSTIPMGSNNEGQCVEDAGPTVGPTRKKSKLLGPSSATGQQLIQNWRARRNAASSTTDPAQTNPPFTVSPVVSNSEFSAIPAQRKTIGNVLASLECASFLVISDEDDLRKLQDEIDSREDLLTDDKIHDALINLCNGWSDASVQDRPYSNRTQWRMLLLLKKSTNACFPPGVEQDDEEKNSIKLRFSVINQQISSLLEEIEYPSSRQLLQSPSNFNVTPNQFSAPEASQPLSHPARPPGLPKIPSFGDSNRSDNLPSRPDSVVSFGTPLYSNTDSQTWEPTTVEIDQLLDSFKKDPRSGRIPD